MNFTVTLLVLNPFPPFQPVLEVGPGEPSPLRGIYIAAKLLYKDDESRLIISIISLITIISISNFNYILKIL